MKSSGLVASAQVDPAHNVPSGDAGPLAASSLAEL
jgi:hypothetical protein